MATLLLHTLRRFVPALVLTATVGVQHARDGSIVAVQPESPGQSQPPSAETSPLPGGIQLQQRYRHRSTPRFDTTIGVIWKDGGPTIRYEIGLLAEIMRRSIGKPTKASGGRRRR